MQTVETNRALVSSVADRVGVKRLAAEAGVPYSTALDYVRRFRAPDYQTHEKLILAAQRLVDCTPSRRPPGARRAPRVG